VRELPIGVCDFNAEIPLTVGDDAKSGVSRGMANLMPASESGTEQGEKQLCSGETFRHVLGIEIERYARYKRDFTVVILRPQDFGNQRAQLQAAMAASERALRLLRTCDVITIFEGNPFVVALLPETGAAGARKVFERFGEHLVVQGVLWTLKAATYSENAASIQRFLVWFNELLLSSGRNPASSESAPSASRYSDLRFATSNVTRSWRDLASAS